jgi:hypothetical protein
MYLGNGLVLTRKSDCLSKIPDVYHSLKTENCFQSIDCICIISSYQAIYLFDYAIDAGHAVLRSILLNGAIPGNSVSVWLR